MFTHLGNWNNAGVYRLNKKVVKPLSVQNCYWMLASHCRTMDNSNVAMPTKIENVIQKIHSLQFYLPMSVTVSVDRFASSSFLC